MFGIFFVRMVKLTSLFAVFIAIAVFPKKLLEWRAENLIFNLDEAPSEPVAIVFGAGLYRNGQPSPVLMDRVAVGSELYHRGKVKTLIMSGTRRDDTYDESRAMSKLAMEMGVPETAIILDPFGTRTYETCRQAKDAHQVRDALLVTQRYHLPRALVTCRGMGINAVGVTADLRDYKPRASRFWEIREIPATIVALWQTYIHPPSKPSRT